MKKRCVSILLALALCLAYVPVTAYADTVTSITVTGITGKYSNGEEIFNDLISRSIEADPYVATGSDGWGVKIDGTLHVYPEGDLYWQQGRTYSLYLPVSLGSGDEFSSSVTATVNGETVDVTMTSATDIIIEYPLYVATDLATVTAEPTAKEGLTYKGSAQALLNAGSTNDGTMQYKLVSAVADWSSTIPTATAVGTYEILWRVKGDETHFDYEEPTPIMVEIGKANATVKADDISKTVGEADPALTATVTGVPVRKKL